MRCTPLAATLAASLASASLASAQECPRNRPTDAGDVAWSYEGADARSYDSDAGNVRVWYAVEGRHAPSENADAETPEAVVLAAGIAEEALAFYDDLGFRAPLGDSGYAECASNGGDGRLDLYLFDFANADGTVIADRCESSETAPCSGFMVIENDFVGLGYESTEVALRTIVPHELFHLVQSAYTSRFDAWWSEGTAQWATKQLYPDLQDFESYLPAFFGDVDRPLDFPPAGAAQPFNYGSAIWPAFLAERYDSALVAEVFDVAGAGTLPTTDALDASLRARGSSLAEAYVTFAQWNASTGSLAGEGGYADAARYPRVDVSVVDSATPTTISGVSAGLSSAYFLLDRSEDVTARFESESHRAFSVPVVDGAANVADARELPVTLRGRALLVVAGTSVDKRDVPYTLEIARPGTEGQSPSGGGTTAPGSSGLAAGTPSDGAGLGAEGGCAVRVPSHEPPWWLAALSVVAASAGRRKRGTLRRSAPGRP